MKYAFDIKKNKLDEIVQINRSEIDKMAKQHSKMYQTLTMAMSVIIKHGSPELVEKYKSLFKELDK